MCLYDVYMKGQSTVQCSSTFYSCRSKRILIDTRIAHSARHTTGSSNMDSGRCCIARLLKNSICTLSTVFKEE